VVDREGCLPKLTVLSCVQPRPGSRQNQIETRLKERVYTECGLVQETTPETRPKLIWSLFRMPLSFAGIHVWNPS